MIKTSFLLFFLFYFHCFLFAQETDLIINNIGMLYAGNIINDIDGAALHCRIKILKDSSRKKKGILKIEGQVLNTSGEPENAFYIFIGNVQNGNKLVVTDTLYSLLNCQPADSIQTFFNHKKTDKLFDGIFNINARLDVNYGVFISVVGGSLFEIKLNDY
jgi:hypothetical protein